MSKSNIVREESKLIRKARGFSNIFVGIDVHEDNYAVAVFSPGDSVIIHEFVMPAQVKLFVRIFSEIKDQLTMCVYEAGFTGFGLARALADAGINAKVVNPASIPRAHKQDTKTDRIDARHLAVFAANNQLEFSMILSEEEDEKRQLARHRQTAKKEFTRIKNRIRSFLSYNDITKPEGLQHWRKNAVTTLQTMPLTVHLRFALDRLLETYEFFKKQVALLMSALRKLEKTPEHADEARRLRKIPGVGLLTTTAVLLEMPRPENFATEKQVGKHFGLSPRLYNSGKTTKSLGITFTGNRRLRHAMIQAAWRWVGKDEHAKRRYQHLVRSTGCPQKAIVGVARKLAIIMWKMRLDGTEYIRGGNGNRPALLRRARA